MSGCNYIVRRTEQRAGRSIGLTILVELVEFAEFRCVCSPTRGEFEIKRAAPPYYGAPEWCPWCGRPFELPGRVIDSELMHAAATRMRARADELDTKGIGIAIRNRASIGEIGKLQDEVRGMRQKAGVLLRLARNMAKREGRQPA